MERRRWQFCRFEGAGDAAIRTLAELGIGDARQVRSFLALGAAGDLVTRSMEMANEAWKENTALTIEASQRYATTESQLQMLKNQWRNLKDTLGSQLLPVVNQFVGLFAKFAQEHGPAFETSNDASPALTILSRQLAIRRRRVVRRWPCWVASSPATHNNVRAVGFYHADCRVCT